MVYMFLAEGFEETEAICPLDMLRRAGADVRTVAVGEKGGLNVRGSHGITVMADIAAANASFDDAKMVILPGGMPGANNLFASEDVRRALSAAEKNDAFIAAICAAPFILGKLGCLNGKSAVCYPGYEKDLLGADVKDADVVVDGKIITARAAGAAMKFGLALAEALFGKAVSDKVKNAVIYDA